MFAAFLAATGNVIHRHETSLLQRDVTIHRGKRLDRETCVPLKNEGGTYFSVNLCVGTPGQCFDVVADTGSNAVIVPSCICKERTGSGCKKNTNCFRGTNKSSTFHVTQPLQAVAMGFGSGSILTVIATDVVRVDGVAATMEECVLLMLNRTELNISGDFQGILGLGIPGQGATPFLLQQPVSVEVPAAAGPHGFNSWRVNCSMEPMLCDDQMPLNQFRRDSRLNKNQFPIPARLQHGRRAGGNAAGDVYIEKLFLQEAKVSRFSMCFRDSGNSGALRFGVPPFTSPLRHIGKRHWGLDFRGLSVGAQGAPAPAEIVLCGPETMKEGMDSPCGIIPDSGTTDIMAPKKQVEALETSLCSKWERCRKFSGGVPSSAAFNKLLGRCGFWFTKGQGILEIPSIFFHVKGDDGTSHAYELTAWAWVTEYDTWYGKICRSSISALKDNYWTEKHGYIWILGTPLFYEYDVGYDSDSNQISLTRGKCEACADDGQPVSLSDDGLRRWPRTVHGEPRIPDYNVDLPL